MPLEGAENTQLIAFRPSDGGIEHLAILIGDPDPAGPVLTRLHGIAHITGGGITDNVPRVLPAGLAARFDTRTWALPPLFRLIQEQGGISDNDMYHTFNMGVGIVVAVAPDDAREIEAQMPDAWRIGEIVRQSDEQRVVIE